MQNEKNKHLLQINKAFDKLDKYTPIWLDFERYYNAKHTEKQFRKLEIL